MKKQHKIIALILFGLVFFAACKKDKIAVNNTALQSNPLLSDGSKIHEIKMSDGSSIFVKEKKNGDYYLSEDITLSKAKFNALLQKSVSTITREGSKSGSAIAAAILNKFVPAMDSVLWTGGVIPYAVNWDFENSWRIDSAIAHYHALTNVRFRPWQPGDTNYILFRNHATENNSAYGMTGGEQIVNMQPQSSVGILIHELGHALGMMHEQTRMDRDQYVIINWNNIDPAFQHNFYTYNATTLQNGKYVQGTDFGLFDTWSIMMYPSNAFAIDPAIPTMTDLAGNPIPTQIIGLTTTDVASINYLYP